MKLYELCEQIMIFAFMILIVVACFPLFCVILLINVLAVPANKEDQ